jgi:hypothetical protein
VRASKGCVVSMRALDIESHTPKEKYIGDSGKAMDSADEYMGDADLGNRSQLSQPSSGNRRQGQRTLATVYDAVAGKLRGSEMRLSQKSGNRI